MFWQFFVLGRRFTALPALLLDDGWWMCVASTSTIQSLSRSYCNCIGGRR